MTTPTTTLLDLPHVLQREVLCFCTDAASLRALLTTCHELHLLHRDPSAAALLLVRLTCKDSGAAIASCAACEGGTPAVVHEVLQLLRPSDYTSSTAGPLGQPHTASKSLLQALLCTACYNGDVTQVLAVRALLPLHAVDECRALVIALKGGPHLGVMRTLLDHGADPSACVVTAARRPAGLAALTLLLHHRPHSPPRPTAIFSALCRAARHENCGAVALLLRNGPPIATHKLMYLLDIAAAKAGAATLQTILGILPVPADRLSGALYTAVVASGAACVQFLLDSGANVRCRDDLLRWALDPEAGRPRPALSGDGCSGCSGCERQEALGRDPWGVVSLLLQRGAHVSPVVRFFLQRSQRAVVVALLRFDNDD